MTSPSPEPRCRKEGCGLPLTDGIHQFYESGAPLQVDSHLFLHPFVAPQEPATPRIGEHGGLCNRTACRAPNARWFNKSTRKYYCDECGPLLTQVNQRDAEAAGLHPLCELHPAPLDSDPREPTMNQCDGCRRGLPLKDGIHRNPDGSYDMMGCTADRYKAAAPQETPEGEPNSDIPECENCVEYDMLMSRLSSLLTGTANALKGEPAPLSQHDWSDLPAVAATHTRSLAALRSAATACVVAWESGDKTSQDLYNALGNLSVALSETQP